MKPFCLLPKSALALAALTFCMGAIQNARAQYVPSGTTAGGGVIIIGSGTGLGALSQSTVPALSPGGFDQVTINPGAMAFATGTDTIAFSTSNNLFLNQGVILGDASFNAVSFIGTGSLSGETVGNSGTISGSSAPDFSGLSGGFAIRIQSPLNLGNVTVSNTGYLSGGNGALGSPGNNGTDSGAGIIIEADGALLTNVVVTNSGTITSGTGGAAGTGAGDGSGNAAIHISSSGSLGNVAVTNSGKVAAGDGGSGGAFGGGGGGYAIYIVSNGGMGGVTVSNSAGGNLIGGNGGSGSNSAGGGGSGIRVASNNGPLSSVTVGNAGSILGGVGGSGTSNGSGGLGGIGIDIYGNDSITLLSVKNSGNITGGIGGSSTNVDGGGDGGIGISIVTLGTLSNSTVLNSGIVTGGSGGGGTGNAAAGGVGVYVEADGILNNVTVTNTGTATGGKGGNGQSFDGGSGASAIEIAVGGINGLVVNNSGNLYGGKGGVSGTGGSSGDGGFAVSIFSNSGNLSNILFNNTGNVFGGNAGDPGPVFAGGGGGAAFNIDTDGNIDKVTIQNSGNLIGGVSGADGNGSEGVTVVSFSGTTSNVSIVNTGLVKAADGGSSSNGGGGGGDGINIQSTVISGGISILNNGVVQGGNGGNGGTGGGGDGENGIKIETKILNGVTITNNGLVTGGNGGTGIPSNNFGGSAIFVGVLSDLSNLAIVNNGVAIGGVSGNGGQAGDAIDLNYGTTVANASVTNNGVLIGGNGTGGALGGNGIFSEIGGLTINNWGSITGGAGTNPAAIQLNTTSNNVINLNGHSSVNGLIAANGNANSNILNLNFTGMSPAAIAALKAQLNAQNLLTGQDSAGSFTVRGVTYTYDPLVLKLNVTSYQLQGLTPNQQAVGASLDSALTNPAPGTPLFNLFNAIDQGGNVPAALQALSPQAYQIYGDLAIQNATAWTQNIDARLNNVRNGSESIDTSGIGGTSDAPTTAGFSKDDSKSSKDVVQTPEEKRWGFFAAGQGLFFRGDNHDLNASGGKANTGGVVTGVDGKAGEHAIVGAFFSYDNADATFNGAQGSGATIESYTGGIYGSYHNGGFYGNGLAAYTYNNYDSTRNILFPGFASSVNGSTHGNQLTANIDGGYDWNITDRLSAGPIAGLQYVHLDVDGFNESGGVGALSLGSQNMNSLQSRVGGRIDYRLHTSNVSSASVDLHAAWQHEYLDDSRTLSAGFAGSGLTGFGIRTSSPSRDAGVVGFGANFTFHDRLTLYAGYELIYWSSSYFEQTVNGGARISF